MSYSRSRHHNERVGLEFSQCSRGMRVFLQGLFDSDAYYNGAAATIITVQPSTRFCTVECEGDLTRLRVEPHNMYVTSNGDYAEETPARWRERVCARGAGEVQA